MTEPTLKRNVETENVPAIPTSEISATPPEPMTYVPPPATWAGRIASLLVFVFILLLLVGGLAISGVIPHSWFFGEHEPATTTLPDGLGVSLVPDQPRTLKVPRAVRAALGIRKGKKDQVAIARPPDTGTPLVLFGSTALDPTRLLRIRARFAPAEVISIGTVRDRIDNSGKSKFRELRSGDRVRKNTVLGVFNSVDVGSKKNDLYDALVQLKLDEEILERAEAARGSVPEIFILNARRSVLGDRNAIVRAENTLRTWSIPPEDIEAIHKEAAQADLDAIKAAKEKDKEKESDKERKGREKKAKEEQLQRWARVELKAPFDATIMERNVAKHEVIVDGTTNLYVLARIDRLTVIANAPEDELPTLQNLTFSQRHWTVHTVGISPEKGIEGPIDEIGLLIDPSQHTAVIKGHIDNLKGRLRGGQFVTVTITLPPPPDTVEIPMDAIVDDGKQCVVFVQTDPKSENYTLRRVLVTHRFDKTAFVRSVLRPEEKVLRPGEKEQAVLPAEPLRKGERVILAGVLELKKELEDREAETAQR